jgi:hypothetical protein
MPHPPGYLGLDGKRASTLCSGSLLRYGDRRQRVLVSAGFGASADRKHERVLVLAGVPVHRRGHPAPDDRMLHQREPPGRRATVQDEPGANRPRSPVLVSAARTTGAPRLTFMNDTTTSASTLARPTHWVYRNVLANLSPPTPADSSHATLRAFTRREWPGWAGPGGASAGERVGRGAARQGPGTGSPCAGPGQPRRRRASRLRSRTMGARRFRAGPAGRASRCGTGTWPRRSPGCRTQRARARPGRAGRPGPDRRSRRSPVAPDRRCRAEPRAAAAAPAGRTPRAVGCHLANCRGMFGHHMAEGGVGSHHSDRPGLAGPQVMHVHGRDQAAGGIPARVHASRMPQPMKPNGERACHTPPGRCRGERRPRAGPAAADDLPPNRRELRARSGLREHGVRRP